MDANHSLSDELAQLLRGGCVPGPDKRCCKAREIDEPEADDFEADETLESLVDDDPEPEHLLDCALKVHDLIESLSYCGDDAIEAEAEEMISDARRLLRVTRKKCEAPARRKGGA